MAPQFQPPPFQPQDYSYIPRTLDDIFNRYNQARAQRDEKNRLQSQFGLQLAGQGIDPTGIDLNDPASVERAWAPIMQDLISKRQREAQDRDLGQRKETAQAELYEAQAKALNRGDIYFDPVSGRQMVVPPGAKPLPKGDRPAQNEFTARGFADKAKQADLSLGNLIKGGFNPAALATGAASLLPNVAKPGSVQQSEQALRQFVNAILRRESGAAIPDSELVNYRKQYWPEAGDTPDTLRQKSESRRLAIAGLEGEAERVPSALPAPAQKPTPEQRYEQLMKEGVPEDQIYKKMASEGY